MVSLPKASNSRATESHVMRGASAAVVASTKVLCSLAVCPLTSSNVIAGIAAMVTGRLSEVAVAAPLS